MDLSSSKIVYRTSKIEGLDIFYREAGPKDAPVVLLLHGFPSSSFMFRNLIPLLADKYHLVAPDFPGYGFSSAPCVNEFEYTFDHFTNVIEGFTEELGLKSYAIYLQDIGASVGYRLAVRHPERVTALIIQNGEAYLEGINRDFSKPLEARNALPPSLFRMAKPIWKGLIATFPNRWRRTGKNVPKRKQNLCGSGY